MTEMEMKKLLALVSVEAYQATRQALKDHEEQKKRDEADLLVREIGAMRTKIPASLGAYKYTPYSINGQPALKPSEEFPCHFVMGNRCACAPEGAYPMGSWTDSWSKTTCKACLNAGCGTTVKVYVPLVNDALKEAGDSLMKSFTNRSKLGQLYVEVEATPVLGPGHDILAAEEKRILEEQKMTTPEEAPPTIGETWRDRKPLF